MEVIVIDGRTRNQKLEREKRASQISVRFVPLAQFLRVGELCWLRLADCQSVEDYLPLGFW